MTHALLVTCWALFAVIHHVMANEPFKQWCNLFLGRHFKYYRLIYSIVAIITLAAVLVLQFSIKSPVLKLPLTLTLLLSIPLGFAGVWLMTVCLVKYFYGLSGVAVLAGKDAPSKLEVTGIHRFVRHPLYLGTLLLITSLFFVFPLLSNLICCVSIFSYVLIGIRSEERKLLNKFGHAYAVYKSHTPMIIPKLG